MISVAGKTLMGILGTSAIGISALSVHSLTKPTKLGPKLSWNGFTILSTNSDTHQDEWNRLVKLYEKAENKWKIGSLSLNISSNQDHASNIAQLKQECQKLFDIDLGSDEISDKEALAKNWCIKEAKGLLDKTNPSQ